MTGDGQRFRRMAAGVIAAVVVAAAVTAAHATVLLPVDFGEMTAASQTIVHGRIVDVRGELTGPRRAIESVVTLEVLTSLKGNVVGRVSFRVPGGRVGRYQRVFVGAPVFTAGDEVVLFLRTRAPELPLPYGLSQGVYRVSRVNGQPFVVPIPADGVAGTVRGDPGRRPLRLDEFARRVQLVLGGAR